MNHKETGSRLDGTFLLRNLHGWCRIKAVKDAEKIGLPLHHLLHHLPGNLRKFIENYVDLGQNGKYFLYATAGYSGQGEKLENPPFPVFLIQIYQRFTNISGEPDLRKLRRDCQIPIIELSENDDRPIGK